MPNFLINVTTRGAKKAAAGMKRLSGSLMSLSKVAMVGAAGGALAMGVAMKKATAAAAEQELQEKKLTQALGKNADALIKQAGALQQTSRFGDEAIIQQQAYLAAIGMSEQQIKEMIPVTMDLAAATGMSLESAVKNTAKTLSGMTGELGESVGSLRDLSAEELRAGKGIDMMRELFKGAAEGEVKTFRGAMDQASNAVGDMMEALGDLALPIAKAGASMTKDFAEKAEEAFDFLGKIDLKETGKNILNNIDFIGQAIVDVLTAYFDFLPDAFRSALGKIVPAAKDVFQNLVDGIVAVGKFIGEPFVLGFKIMSTKIKKVFAIMWEFIKTSAAEALKPVEEAANAVGGLFGVKLNIKEMFGVTEGGTEAVAKEYDVLLSKLTKKLKATDMGKFFVGAAEDNIKSFADLKNEVGTIVSELGEKFIVLKTQTKDEDGNSNLLGTPKDGELEDLKEKTTKISDMWKSVQEQYKALQKTSEKATASIAAGAVTQGESMTNTGLAMQNAASTAITGEIGKAIATQMGKAVSSIPFPFNIAVAAAAGAAIGSLMTGAVTQLKKIKTAATGADFIASGPQLMMVGDNPSQRERIQVTPLGGDPNINGPQGGGAVTVNVSGNLLSPEYVEETLAEQIKEAIRRGYDFGLV